MLHTATLKHTQNPIRKANHIGFSGDISVEPREKIGVSQLLHTVLSDVHPRASPHPVAESVSNIWHFLCVTLNRARNAHKTCRSTNRFTLCRLMCRVPSWTASPPKKTFDFTFWSDPAICSFFIPSFRECPPMSVVELGQHPPVVRMNYEFENTFDYIHPPNIVAIEVEKRLIGMRGRENSYTMSGNTRLFMGMSSQCSRKAMVETQRN